MRKGKKVINLAQESIDKNVPKPTIYDDEIKAYREVREKQKKKRILMTVYGRNQMEMSSMSCVYDLSQLPIIALNKFIRWVWAK